MAGGQAAAEKMVAMAAVTAGGQSTVQRSSQRTRRLRASR